MRATSCQREEDAGSSALFSLSLTSGGAAYTRLRVRGYTIDDVGAAAVSVSRTVEATTARNPGVLLVDLVERCRTERVRCAEGETCDPATGECAAVERVRELVPIAEAPRVLGCGTNIEEPSTAPATYCRTGDESCPTGCTAAQDRDCRNAPGSACERDDDCRTDLVCADGVCCITACDDPCASCKNAGSEGECGPIDYSASQDPLHCGGCGIVCGDANAREVACDAGRCAPRCRDGFADCDADRNAPNGCETDVLTDAENCGRCGAECEYTYCRLGRCAEPRGPAGEVSGTSGYYPLQAGLAVAVDMELPTGTVYGINAHIDATDLGAPGQVVMAIADSDLQGFPGEVLGETAPTTVVDADDGGSAAPAVTHAAMVSPASIAAGTYWILVAATKDVQVRTYVGDRRRFDINEPLIPLTFAGQPLFGEMAQSLQNPLSVNPVMVDN